MWPAFDLVNRVFMELGSLRLIRGVPGTEGVQNGVSLEVYEGKREAKKNMKKKGRKERKEKGREEEKKRGKKKR